MALRTRCHPGLEGQGCAEPLAGRDHATDGGMAGGLTVAARRRRRCGSGLIEVIDILRLRNRDELHGRQRFDNLGWGTAVIDVQAYRGRAEDREILRRYDAHAEVRYGGAQALDAEVGANVHHHLVGLQPRLVRWRDVDDAAVDAGRQKLIARRGTIVPVPVPVPGADPGVCCGGSRMPPWVVFTTGAVLSAANCSVLVRLRICCVCCAASCSASPGENSVCGDGCVCVCGVSGCGSGVGVGVGGVGGAGGDADGSWPVLTKTQVGSVQPAMIDGKAGGFDEEFGLLSAMNRLTVLPAPPLAVPLAEELVMVPTGKLDPGIEPGWKLTNWALLPAKAPTALSAPLVELPDALELSMQPKLAPTKPPTMLLLPLPVTLPLAVDCSIKPRLVPTKPPR
jgi:hypothetical protein